MFWNYELKIVAHYTDSPAIWDFLQPRQDSEKFSTKTVTIRFYKFPRGAQTYAIEEESFESDQKNGKEEMKNLISTHKKMRNCTNRRFMKLKTRKKLHAWNLARCKKRAYHVELEKSILKNEHTSI